MAGYQLTGAPLAVDGKIIMGMSGGELGVRGYLDAYDPATGKRLWRTYTIPGPGEKGNETWAGDSWKTGGAPTWLTGSYDPGASICCIWGTGNPAPDYNAEDRKGDNLYTDSVLAIDPDTGKIKWHYQFTPNDDHDWDSTEDYVLTRHGGERQGAEGHPACRPQRLLLCAGSGPTASSSGPSRSCAPTGTRALTPRAGRSSIRPPSPPAPA